MNQYWRSTAGSIVDRVVKAFAIQLIQLAGLDQAGDAYQGDRKPPEFLSAIAVSDENGKPANDRATPLNQIERPANDELA